MSQPVLLRDLLPSALRMLASPVRSAGARAADHAAVTRRDASTLSHLLVRVDESIDAAAPCQR